MRPQPKAKHGLAGIVICLAVANGFSLPAQARNYRPSSARFNAGFFNDVQDLKVIREIGVDFQKKLRDIGIAANVTNCVNVGFVAVGSASGERAYGAHCRVKIGRRAPADYWLCSSEMTGLYLTDDQAPEDIPSTEDFIRRTCW